MEEFTSSNLDNRSLADGERLRAQRGNLSLNLACMTSSEKIVDESSSKGRQPQRRTNTMTPRAQVSTARE